MKEQADNSRGFLKDKMGSFQVSPPDTVWKEISGRLGGRSRRSVVFFALAAAASVALALSLGIYYFGKDLPLEPGLAETAELPVPVPVEEEKENRAMWEGKEEESRSGETTELQEETELQDKAELLEDSGSEDGAIEMAMATETGESQFELTTPSIAEVLAGADTQRGNPSDGAVTGISREQTTFALDQAAAEQLLAEQTALPEAGQEVEIDVKEDKDPRWMLGAAMSPLYSFRDAENQYINPEYNHESGHLSYAGGVHVAYRTTRRLALETGVFFNKMGIDIGNRGIQLFSKETDMAPAYGWEDERSAYTTISNSVGNIVSESGEVFVNSYMVNASENQIATDAEFYATAGSAEQGISQHLDYLEIPFNLRYTVVDRAIRLQLVGGLSTNLLVNNYVTMDTPEGRTEIGYMSNVRNVNYSGNAGIGLAYDFLGHFSFSLEPRFRYFLNSVNDATLPSTRPYTLGIYTGLSYIF